MAGRLLRTPSSVLRRCGSHRCHSAAPAMASAAPPVGFTALPLPPTELTLAHTLPTGQAFRWRRCATDNEWDVYDGVIARRAVRLAQRPGQPASYRVLGRCPAGSAPPAGDAAALAAFFNAADGGGPSLAALHAAWADPADAAFAAAAAAAPGARVLDQDPLETLLAFICSSNNSIGRIAGMVAHLAAAYGDRLPVEEAGKEEAGKHHGGGGGALPPPFAPPAGPFHAFPALAALAAAVTEADLRAAGFGYRAKYVAGTVAALAAKPGGGEAWLAALRDPAVPAADAVAALETLPGVGPKVAACVALYALRKPGVVPVDTHVWKVAQKHYARALAGKTLSRDVMARVQDAFVARFGERAGWAQTVLFVADLPAVARAARGAAPSESGESGFESGEGGEGGEGGGPPDPAAAARAARAARRASDGWEDAVGAAKAKKARAGSSSADEEGDSGVRVPTPAKAER